MQDSEDFDGLISMFLMFVGDDDEGKRTPDDVALGVSSPSTPYNYFFCFLYPGLKKEAKEHSTEHEESFDLSMVRPKIEGDFEGTNLDGHEIRLRLRPSSLSVLLLLLAPEGSVYMSYM